MQGGHGSAALGLLRSPAGRGPRPRAAPPALPGPEAAGQRAPNPRGGMTVHPPHRPDLGQGRFTGRAIIPYYYLPNRGLHRFNEAPSKWLSFSHYGAPSLLASLRGTLGRPLMMSGRHGGTTARQRALIPQAAQARAACWVSGRGGGWSVRVSVVLMSMPTIPWKLLHTRTARKPTRRPHSQR